MQEEIEEEVDEEDVKDPVERTKFTPPRMEKPIKEIRERSPIPPIESQELVRPRDENIAT